MIKWFVRRHLRREVRTFRLPALLAMPMKSEVIEVVEYDETPDYRSLDRPTYLRKPPRKFERLQLPGLLRRQAG